jgi:hypothetical protein
LVFRTGHGSLLALDLLYPRNKRHKSIRYSGVPTRKYTIPTTASTDRATAALEELTEALKNPSAAKPFLNTGNKLNEAITALTEILAMKRTTTSTSAKRSVTVSPKTQRTRGQVPRITTPQTNIHPQMPVNPRLARHRGTRGLSSTVSLDSFNSPNNVKNITISKNNNDNNNNKNITGIPITKPNISDNISNTQREENSQQCQQLRTRNKETKQKHKLTTTVYKIFEGGTTHQGYICSFDPKEGFYMIKYRDGDIEEADTDEVTRILKKRN